MQSPTLRQLEKKLEYTFNIIDKLKNQTYKRNQPASADWPELSCKGIDRYLDYSSRSLLEL